MKNVNIVCTSKPGDGLLHYSYEHCCYLNSIGIKSQLIIITHFNFKQKDYINALEECYITTEDIIFDNYIPNLNETTLIMGRSLLTWPYLNKNKYSQDQLLTLHLLFKNKLISVYNENHPKEYYKAIDYFAPKEIIDLCDKEIYPNGKGEHFRKIINFNIYKPVKSDIKFKYLFLGTNDIYYKEIEKHIDKFESHGIISYKEKYINNKLNNIFVPVKNLLGSFETYVYTKPYFDPAPRIIQECKWLNKKIIYLRDKNIKDGGPVYYNLPSSCLTDKTNKDNINILIKSIKE